MFNNPKYLTKSVQDTIPIWLIHLMWFMVAAMEVSQQDYLQVFRLRRTSTSQYITHTQEQPPYQYELDVPCPDAVTAKIFVIDDGTHSTMMLAEEY